MALSAHRSIAYLVQLSSSAFQKQKCPLLACLDKLGLFLDWRAMYEDTRRCNCHKDGRLVVCDPHGRDCLCTAHSGHFTNHSLECTYRLASLGCDHHRAHCLRIEFESSEAELYRHYLGYRIATFETMALNSLQYFHLMLTSEVVFNSCEEATKDKRMTDLNINQHARCTGLKFINNRLCVLSYRSS